MTSLGVQAQRPSQAQVGRQVWDQVCRHIDGLALGSTMAALSQRGVLRFIAAGGRTSAGRLRERAGGNAGFLQVALRLLADQGWVRRTGPAGTDDLEIEATPRGRVVLGDLAGSYVTASRFLPVAAQMDTILSGAADRDLREEFAAFARLMQREWGVPPGVTPVSARLQVLAHLDGHLVAPVMSALTRTGVFEAGPGGVLEPREPSPDVLRTVWEILAGQGWVSVDGGTARLTAAGRAAVRCAGQYAYPVGYLPTLRRVPELLFGDPGQAWTAEGASGETHVDRELDIGFSGDVFTQTCQAPFLDLARPPFQRLPVADQPSVVVDLGCGDGRLLETLYGAVRDQTERGRCLRDRPLLCIGAETSSVARRITAQRLAASRVPHLVIEGDIADPGGLSRTLRALRVDPSDALYVSKSVIHDRAFGAVPMPRQLAGAVPPESEGAFARPDGTAVPSSSMARDLAAFFSGWRTLASRHGMLVIEAHSAGPAVCARLIGRTLLTALDATHGYSCQYPVEPEVFAWAAHTAGFRSARHLELGTETMGHVALTIDHFVPSG